MSSFFSVIMSDEPAGLKFFWEDFPVFIINLFSLLVDWVFDQGSYLLLW